MKTHIITLICAVLLTATASGQGYYSTDTVQGEGFRFKCEYRYSTAEVKMYNINNPFTNIPERYKDGSKLVLGRGLGYSDNLYLKWEEELRIISGVFTATQKQSMKESKDKLVLFLHLSPESGRILAIEYLFDAADVYGSIPPSTYYLIEQRLKASVVFNITTEGAKQNYIWSYVEYRGE